MHILELDIEAFGPFTQKQLVFPKTDSNNGLQIIYGKNEAGKSSCLRALKALLYGIPSRTPDNFIHANPKLRISGCLQHSNGDELAITRRKGRLNTLLDKNEKPLDEAALAPYLQGLSLEFFETLFGLDHDTLIRGGRAMLTQQGDVGQALFSAGMGIADLRSILQQLEQEAKNLYTPRGKKPEIKALLADYRASLKHIREQSLSAPQWKKQRKELDSLKQDLQRQSEQLKQLKHEQQYLQDLQKISALLAKRERLQHAINALGEVPKLSTHFSTQRIKALKTHEDSEAHIQDTETEIAQLKAKQARIQLDTKLLKHASQIEALQHVLSAYIKDKREEQLNQLEQQTLADENTQLLVFLSPEIAQFKDKENSTLAENHSTHDQQLAQRLAPFLQKRQRIRALAQQQQSLQDALGHTVKQQQKAVTQLAQAQLALAELPVLYDTKALEYSIKRTREHGDLEKQKQALCSEYEKQQQHCQRDIKRLGLCTDDVKVLETLPIPSVETIERFDRQFRQLDDQIRHTKTTAQSLQQQLRQLDGELKALALSGKVPTEEALQQSREQRENLWQTIRPYLLTPSAETLDKDKQSRKNLSLEFETEINRSDQLADRLRRESERVHKQADLLAQKDLCEKQAAELKQQTQQQLKAQQVLQNEWQTLWQETTLNPLPPNEMRAWRQNVRRLQDHISQLNETLERLEHFNQNYEKACQLLRESLHHSGGLTESENSSIHWLLVQAEQRFEHLRDQAKERTHLAKEIKKQTQDVETTKRDHQQAQQLWQDWQQQWQAVLQPLGLNTDTLAIEINDLLDKTSQWFSNRDKQQKLAKKAQHLQQTTQAFEQQCQTLREQFKGYDNELSPDQWLQQGYRQLKIQQKQQRELENLQQKLSEKTVNLEQWQQRLLSSEKTLRNLCQEARCETPEALETIEQRVKQAQALQKDAQHLQQQLQEYGDSQKLVALEAELAEYNAEQLGEKLNTLNDNMNAQEQERDQLNQQCGRLEEALRQSEAQAGAAESLDAKHAILAKISNKVQSYLRYRLAHHVLQQHIERYRQEHQGPVLKRAGEYFSTLTCGSFQGLRVDYDSRDQSVLLGERQTEEYVGVEGMSDGTRDQLYLALRLATLEQHMRSAEPLPFIVDDILINFDDERALAGLSALNELAQKTQIILFTHHHHMIDLFEQHKPEGQTVSVYEL